MIIDMIPGPNMPFALDVNDLNSEDWQRIENARRYWVRNEGDA
jgi:hypothetical protein